MKFPTKAKLKEYLNDDISVHYWTMEWDNYICNQQLGTKCWTRSAIFLVEVNRLETHDGCPIAYDVIVSGSTTLNLSLGNF